MLVKTHQPASILTVPKSSNPHSSIPLQFLLKHACNLKVCAFIIVQFLGKNSENLRWIRNSPARPELLGLWVFLLSSFLSLPAFLVSESPFLPCLWTLLHSEMGQAISCVSRVMWSLGLQAFLCLSSVALWGWACDLHATMWAVSARDADISYYCGDWPVLYLLCNIFSFSTPDVHDTHGFGILTVA